MAKSIRVNQKKRAQKQRGRGRPPRPGGRDPVLAVRLPPAIIAEVDLVAEQRGCGRSEAVRRLLEDALARPSAEVERVAQALARGDVDAAIRAVGLDPMQLQSFARSITDAFESGGEAMAPTKPKPRGNKATTKASDMAGQEIDRMGNKLATDEERASRKRRLLKGPKEFRDMRGDLPKAKTKD